MRFMTFIRIRWLSIEGRHLLPLAILTLMLPAAGVAQEASNMALLAHHPLDGRPSYQPMPHLYGDRWILFTGHHAGEAVNSLNGEVEGNGTSVLDVTDPSNPVYLAHIAAPDWSEHGSISLGTGLHASLVGQRQPRGLRRHRSERADVPRDGGLDGGLSAHGTRSGFLRYKRHTQELVGLRNRCRLCDLEYQRLEEMAEPAGLRSESTGGTDAYSRLQPFGHGADLDDFERRGTGRLLRNSSAHRAG